MGELLIVEDKPNLSPFFLFPRNLNKVVLRNAPHVLVQLFVLNNCSDQGKMAWANEATCGIGHSLLRVFLRLEMLEPFVIQRLL